MIDTLTVNYALDKMAEAYKAVAPTVQGVSEKYVRYIVFQEALGFAIASVLLLAGLFFGALAIFAFTKSKALTEVMESDLYEVILIVTSIISALCLVFGVPGFFCEGYEFFLAYTNPEMYAIQELIKAAK